MAGFGDTALSIRFHSVVSLQGNPFLKMHMAIISRRELVLRFVQIAILAVAAVVASNGRADSVEAGQDAPLFILPNQAGKEFALASRKGAGWTVLYFYPKAETPGCTKQACAFRDSIKLLRALDAEVYGISADTVQDQAAFHDHHQLQFDLLADPEGSVISQYGAKIPVIGLAKRWTFILDPDLKIRSIQKDVDPALDAKRVAEELKNLQHGI